MKTPILRTLALGLAVLLAGSMAPPVQAEAPASQGTKKIVIVHTNDLHGNVEPDYKGRGGLTRIATLLRQLRAQHPGAVMYLDAGDVAQGTPLSNTFHGEPMWVSLNSMKPAAGTIGNHEFDWGPKVLLNMTSKADYPILVANVVDSKGHRPFKPFQVFRVNGVAIGVIGLLSTETPTVVKAGNTGDYKFLDPAATVREFLPQMRKQGARYIVALTHQGLDADRKLASDVPQINLIVGGHSHDKTAKAELAGHRTYIVQADRYGRFAGVVEMTVDTRTHQVVGVESRLVEINDKAGLEADPTVVAIAEKYNARVKPLMAQLVGKTATDLHKRYAEGQLDSTLGNAIADAMRVKTGADVAVYNWGGIRDEQLAGGDVNRGAIFRILPFDDQVVRVRLKGSDLMELMGQGLLLNPDSPMQVSGAQVQVDLANKKVLDVKVGGKALDPNATYTVATTEFMAGGGDGAKALTKGTLQDRFDFARDVFIDYLDDQPVLQAPQTGRIVVVGK